MAISMVSRYVGELHQFLICYLQMIASFFFKVEDREAGLIIQLLCTHELASGQVINLQKLEIFFSGNVSASMKEAISNCLGMTQPLNHGHYLGLPSLVGHNKRQVFSLLKGRLW